MPCFVAVELALYCSICSKNRFPVLKGLSRALEKREFRKELLTLAYHLLFCCLFPVLKGLNRALDKREFGKELLIWLIICYFVVC